MYPFSVLRPCQLTFGIFAARGTTQYVDVRQVGESRRKKQFRQFNKMSGIMLTDRQAKATDFRVKSSD